MPLFPSQEWCDAFAQILNNTPESASYVPGSNIWIITPDQTFPQTVRLYMAFDHGHVSDIHIMTEGETREAEIISTAPFGVWRRIIEGKLNPLPAMVRGQLKLEGLSMKAIRNAKIGQAMFEYLAHLPTEFPAEN